MRIGQSKTARFDIPNDPDQAWIELRHLTPGEVEDIQAELDIFETVYRPDATGVMVPEARQRIVKGEKRYLSLCKSLVGWGGINDGDGRPLPCTDENKIRLARDVDGFAEFVARCREKLAEDVAKAREAAEKNS